MVNTGTGDQRYHRSMSEHPPSGPSAAHGPSGYPAAPTGFPGTAAGSPSWPSAPPRAQSRALTFVALAIALIATGLAIVGWFRPSTPQQSPGSAPPTYSPQQVSDAKARACAAVDVVQKGVGMHAGTGSQAQLSSDPTMAEAQSANARLAIIAGGWYLRDHLDPATPQPLADAIRHVSGILLDLGQNYLAGLRNEDPTQSGLIKDGNSGFDHSLELCK
jgi:hypothetical protein